MSRSTGGGIGEKRHGPRGGYADRDGQAVDGQDGVSDGE